MHFALIGIFQAKWSNMIHDEWIRNVLKNRPDLTKSQLNRTKDLMNKHALDCLVTNFEHLIHDIELPDKDDRHVLAAAIHTQANLIITFNLKDFPKSILRKHSIDAIHPDDFISGLFDTHEAKVLKMVKNIRTKLKYPPMDAMKYIGFIERQSLPAFASRIRKFKDLI